MENKVLFLDPLCPHRSFKCGTEGLLGAAILGGTGLLSGGLGAVSASSNNRAALAFNKWSQLQAQQYNTQMYERQLADQEALYTKYQSPQAIAEQLAKAGINPSALAAKSGFNGGSMPSVPSAGSASPLSAPALENSGAYIGQGIEQMSRVVSNLADSQMKQRQTTKILAEIKGQEIANAQADFSNYLMQKYGENEKVAQLNDLIASAALKDAQKDYEGANIDLTKAIKMIKDKELNIKDEEYSQLLYKGSRLVQLYDDQHNLILEQQKTEKSKRASNYANANLANEQALTVKELRGWQAGFEQARTEIMQTESFVKRNTLWEQCESYLAELRAKKMLPEQVEQAIRKAKKENDWYEINELLGVVDTGTKVAGTYYGAKTGQGFVSAQNTRNEIQSQYNQYLFNKDNEAYKARRSAVAGSGHYWGQEY